MPMDETLAAAAVDLSGRPCCVVKAKIAALRVGDFQVELIEDFFQGFAQAAKANVHLSVLYGRSSHHQVEAGFKAFARALRFAVAKDKRLRNVLPGKVCLLPSTVKLPHMGWNQIVANQESRLLAGIGSSAYFYFAHSYAAPDSDGLTMATCFHGTPFAAVVERQNIYGVQFHPEKSGDSGSSLLQNFLRIAA